MDNYTDALGAWLYKQLAIYNAGADPGFQVKGGALKNIARKLLGYFVWKITILRQQILFFPILGGGGRRIPPPPPPRPGSAPAMLCRIMFKILTYKIRTKTIKSIVTSHPGSVTNPSISISQCFGLYMNTLTCIYNQ